VISSWSDSAIGAFLPSSYNGFTQILVQTTAGQDYINIMAAPGLISLSGQITLSGTGLSGVTVTLSGSQSSSAVTDGSGNYIFGGLAVGGNYTVTPSISGFTFSPPSQTFNTLSNNQTANFAATSIGSGITVSGQVTSGGVGLSGVTININGSQTTSTSTNASGSYSFSGLFGGVTYTLSAALAGYSFSTPVTVSNLSANQTANFTGIAVTGLDFYPVTPCRIADTRSVAGFTGQFGPPSLVAGTAGIRTFNLLSSSCTTGIPT
jgi:hypothetical protein